MVKAQVYNYHMYMYVCMFNNFVHLFQRVTQFGHSFAQSWLIHVYAYMLYMYILILTLLGVFC